MANFAVRPS